MIILNFISTVIKEKQYEKASIYVPNEDIFNDVVDQGSQFYKVYRIYIYLVILYGIIAGLYMLDFVKQSMEKNRRKKYNYNRMITKSIVLVNFKINRVRNSLPRKMYKALQNY